MIFDNPARQSPTTPSELNKRVTQQICSRSWLQLLASGTKSLILATSLPFPLSLRKDPLHFLLGRNKCHLPCMPRGQTYHTPQIKGGASQSVRDDRTEPWVTCKPHSFLRVLEAASPRSRCWQIQRQVRSRFLVHGRHFRPVSPHGGRVRELSGVFVLRALIPLLKMPPNCLFTSQSSPPYTITLRVRIQCRNLRAHTESG